MITAFQTDRTGAPSAFLTESEKLKFEFVRHPAFPALAPADFAAVVDTGRTRLLPHACARSRAFFGPPG